MNVSDIKLPITQSQTNLGDGYLQFQLNHHHTAILLVNFTQEVVVLPRDFITSIPNVSELFLGLMNWQNRVIWVIDLPRIFGLEAQVNRLRQCNIIIIRHQTETIGLMVPSVKGTVRFNAENIQHISDGVTPNIIPYLEGCIWCGNELNLVLNIEAILKSTFLHEK